MTVEEVAKVVMNYDSSDGENTESFSDESCRSEDFEPQGGKCAYLWQFPYFFVGPFWEISHSSGFFYFFILFIFLVVVVRFKKYHSLFYTNSDLMNITPQKIKKN